MVAPFIIPAACRFSWVLIPPVTLRAPVVVEVEVVSSVRVTTPSRVAAAPNKAPEIPTPPPMVTAPVVFEEDVVEPVTPKVPFIFTASVFAVFIVIVESAELLRV